ncbi:hypothetical protein HZB60_03690 [candidate division KSB1 bacterium]|nr:hypothetical protein [candidate division KSB1 bacterium]
MLPPPPSWDGLHPLIIHFPIALLITAPLLIIAALVLLRQRHGLMIAAFLLMALGSAAAFIAVSTGEAAGELAERNATVSAAIEQHEELAELTRSLFTVLTVMFAAIVFGPALLRKRLAAVSQTIVMLAFLVFYSGGVLLLANTAHQGGRLVHELGVKAMMTTAEQRAAATTVNLGCAESSHSDSD